MTGPATRPEKILGERIEWAGPGGVNRGTVWSPGPLPRSVWALPDGYAPGEVFALVKLRTKSDPREREVRRMTREEQRREVAKFEATWRRGYLTQREALEIAKKGAAR